MSSIRTFSIFILLLMIRNGNLKAFFKMTNAICESTNQSWVIFHECRLRAINRNITTLTIELTFLQPLDDSDARMELKKKTFGYNPTIFNYTVNACTFMERQKHRTFKTYFEIMKKFSTLNHTCPFEGKQMLKDFYYDPNNFTLPLPSGDYQFILSWLVDRKPLIIITVHISYFQDIFGF